MTRGAAGEGGGAAVDDQAIERYRYMLRTAPPETIERAHAEAFARLTPEQRRKVLEGLAQEMPEDERAAVMRDDASAASLARAATRAEIRRPGVIERTFGTMPAGSGGSAFGPAAGPGLGGLLAGTLLSSLAGTVIGSMIAQQFFSQHPQAGPLLGGDGTGSPDAAGSAGDAAAEVGNPWTDAPADTNLTDASHDAGELGDGDLGGLDDGGSFDV